MVARNTKYQGDGSGGRGPCIRVLPCTRLTNHTTQTDKCVAPSLCTICSGRRSCDCLGYNQGLADAWLGPSPNHCPTQSCTCVCTCVCVSVWCRHCRCRPTDEVCVGRRGASCTTHHITRTLVGKRTGCWSEDGSVGGCIPSGVISQRSGMAGRLACTHPARPMSRPFSTVHSRTRSSADMRYHQTQLFDGKDAARI